MKQSHLLPLFGVPLIHLCIVVLDQEVHNVLGAPAHEHSSAVECIRLVVSHHVVRHNQAGSFVAIGALVQCTVQPEQIIVSSARAQIKSIILSKLGNKALQNEIKNKT